MPISHINLASGVSVVNATGRQRRRLCHRAEILQRLCAAAESAPKIVRGAHGGIVIVQLRHDITRQPIFRIARVHLAACHRLRHLLDLLHRHLGQVFEIPGRSVHRGGT